MYLAQQHHRRRRGITRRGRVDSLAERAVDADADDEDEDGSVIQGRDRHAAREFTLTGPITLTIISTQAQPTISTLPGPVVVTTTATPTLTTSTATLTTSPTNTDTTPPSPIASANGANPTDPASSNSDGSSSDGSGLKPVAAGALAEKSRLTPGAIVGIVIGCLVIMLILCILALRNKFIKARESKRRKQRKSWLRAGGISNLSATDNNYFADEKLPDTARSIGSFGGATPGAFRSTMASSSSSLPSPSQPQMRQQQQPIPPVPPMPPSVFNYNNPVSPRTVPSAGAFPSSPTSPTSSPVAITTGAGVVIGSVGSGGVRLASASSTDRATVKFTFIPSLPDELSISDGEQVLILQEFDDGWAFCENGRGVKGMVPLECLERTVGSASRDSSLIQEVRRNSKRASSLGGGFR